jgi:hypothetical protein
MLLLCHISYDWLDLSHLARLSNKRWSRSTLRQGYLRVYEHCLFYHGFIHILLELCVGHGIFCNFFKLLGRSHLARILRLQPGIRGPLSHSLCRLLYHSRLLSCSQRRWLCVDDFVDDSVVKWFLRNLLLGEMLKLLGELNNRVLNDVYRLCKILLLFFKVLPLIYLFDLFHQIWLSEAHIGLQWERVFNWSREGFFSYRRLFFDWSYRLRLSRSCWCLSIDHVKVRMGCLV